MLLAKCEMRTTRKGDAYKLFTLSNGKRLSVFQFDDSYNLLNEGSDIADDQLVYDSEYDNYKLKKVAKRGGGSRRDDIKAAMGVKTESIRKAQENKEQGVRIAAIFRDATLIVSSMVKAGTFEGIAQEELGANIRAAHRAWREWLDGEWEDTKNELEKPY